MKVLNYDINRDAVARGAFVSTVIAIPLAIVIGRVIDENSNWQVPFTLAVLAAFVVGGGVAGRLAPLTPAVHGALTAIPCLVIVTLAAIAARVFANGDATVVLVIGQVIIATTLGMLGGTAASRFGDRTRSLIE